MKTGHEKGDSGLAEVRRPSNTGAGWGLRKRQAARTPERKGKGLEAA